jgi:dihydrofolate synthase / folylpolyglutamate synthase
MLKMIIESLDQANRLLKSYIPAVKEITGKDITLQRMIPLMKLLGNPESKLKIIHIAGTSGKTSTSYYIASLLRASGKRVGLTVSPHITTITERVQINMVPLSEDEFCRELSVFIETTKLADPRPTYFELVVAFAYWYFAKTKTEYAVIETGLGGMHDATNVANRPDKVCVITDIGYDHTKVLGSTIAEITAQKAGIIYKGNQVFSYQQSPTVMNVLRSTCSEKRAVLNPIKSSGNDLLSPIPLFQQRNFNLAKAVYGYLAERDNLQTLTAGQLDASMATQIPARMEAVSYKGKTIIMDGAHNPQKLRALTDSIKHAYPGKKIAVLAGFVRSRKPRLNGNINELLTIADYLITTSFVPNQEMYTNSADPAKIVEYCLGQGFRSVEADPIPEKALAKLIKRPEPILLITGSFYLMGNIRPIIISLND